MNKFNTYVSNQERLSKIRKMVAEYRAKWKVSEPQMARYCGISLGTFRSFMKNNSKRYQERIVSSIEKYFERKNEVLE